MRFLSLALMVLPLAAYADTLNLNYTVTGQGGVSNPLEPLSANPFSWIDDTGGVSGSAFAAYGYAPVSSPLFSPQNWTGSLMLSDPFTLNNGDTLSVTAILFEQVASTDYAVGFGLLLQNSMVQAILFNQRPDGGFQLSDQAAPPSFSFAPTSPGVAETSTPAGDPSHNGNMPVALGGNQYGPWVGFAPPYCGYVGYPTACSSQVTSSYAPGSGTYQLLFGEYFLPAYGTALGYAPGPTAMAVDSVSVTDLVPEGESWLTLLAVLSATMGLARRRKARSES